MPSELLAQFPFDYAQLAQYRPSETAITMYIMISLAAAVGTVAILMKAQQMHTRMILLGLLLAVAATGYGTMAGAYPMVPTLMRIALILVLGGVAYSVLVGDRLPPAVPTREPVDAT
jgi:hypothetical protein